VKSPPANPVSQANMTNFISVRDKLLREIKNMKQVGAKKKSNN
jgi:hypothetical protein